MELKIEKLEIADHRRILAVSDIHGHCGRLKRLLEKARFSPRDELFLCGDYVERGPENLKSLRYVMELSKKPNVHVLGGNMDAFTADCICGVPHLTLEQLYERIARMNRRHGTCLITEMCEEAGLKLKSAACLPGVLARLRVRFREELDFIFSLPALIETQSFIFVHGGIPTENTEELLKLSPYAVMKNDGFMNQGLQFSKYVIVGHYPTTLYRDFPSCAPIIDRESRIIDIDGGCGVNAFGQLNALIVPHIRSTDFSHVRCDDFPVFKADRAQEAGGGSVKIIWTDNFVERLSQKDGVSTIRRLSDGAVLKVPDSYLFTESNGALRCENFNSFKIPARPGEAFGLIKAEPGFGRLLKKGDVFGWYMEEKDRA